MCTVVLPPGVNPTAINKYVISRAVLLRKGNASGKIYRGNENTNFVFSNILHVHRKSCLLFDNVEKNIVERGRPRTTINTAHAHG